MVVMADRDVKTSDESSMVSLLESGIESLGHAMAVLDVESDRLIWCSTHWCDRVPLLTNQALSGTAHGAGASTGRGHNAEASWSQAVAERSDLALIFDAARVETKASGQVRDELTGGLVRLDIRKLDRNQYVLQLHSEAPAVDDMHQYMQAREHLFTTSRTISVSEMATTLAHEIRQPIATISNILRGVKMRLARGDAADGKIEEALDKALSQAQFTDSIILRIRDFTEARRPKQQTVEICSILRESVGLMDWLFNNSQCRVTLELSNEPLFCDGDQTMLQQVMVNLLRNGVEAMQEREPSGRHMNVSARRHREAVRISIHDHGHGLEGKENTLFVPFATSKSDGMGVGLNICRSFVELHQGRLWLAPNADGGCTSHVELPLSNGSPTSQAEREEPDDG